MALPGKKATELAVDKQRLKLLLYGDWKVGKTTAAAQFPKSYFIDAEHGAAYEQYRDLLRAADAMYYETNSFDDVVGAVRSLISEEHDRITLVIDPISVIYSDLLEIGERLKGDAWGRHTAYADQAMKRLFLLVDRLDMNVIMTSHAKPEYEGSGKDREATGNLTPDAWKKLPYAFDLILELRRSGEKRQCLVRGGRLKEFQDGERFEWSYAEFLRRLGPATLERLAVTIPMVTAEQLAELQQLISAASLDDEKRAKLLTKLKIATFEDLTEEQAERLATVLRSKVAADTAKF